MFIEREKGIISPEEFFSKLKPCTDLDGPIFDIHTQAIIRCNEELGTNYCPSDIREWHAIRNFALAAGRSFEEACDLEERLYYHPDELKQVGLTPGAEEFTKWFYDHDIPLEIISSRRPNLRQVTLDVLKEKLPFIKGENVMMQQTNMMDGDIFKAWMIKVKGIGIYFEDVPTHVKTILDYTDAHVVHVSHMGVLDHYDKKRLIRFSGSIGQAANMLEVNRYFNL